MHPFANLIAVDDERAERRDDEERQEAVQQRGPRGDEADPVADQQHPAMAPTNVDRLIRRTIRTTSATRTTPSRAPVNRQPNPL